MAGRGERSVSPATSQDGNEDHVGRHGVRTSLGRRATRPDEEAAVDDDMDIGPAPWPEHTQHYQQQRPPGAGGEGTAAAPSPFSYSTTSSSSPDQNNAFSKPTTSSAAGAGAGADAAIPPPRNTTNTRRRQPLLSRFRALFHPVHGKLRPFRLLREDAAAVRARWVSDWTVMNQLVLASAVYVFFTNILPGITFASDLYVLTGQSWGTIEVVFSTGLCGLIFSLLAAQPLCILGVTGPFTVLAENMYKLCTETFDVPFLPVMAWSLLHAAWMHLLLAVLNAHDWTMEYVTTFSADVFSLLNSVIYLQKAVLTLQRNRAAVPLVSFLYSVLGAAGTCLLAVLLSTATRWAPLLGRTARMGLSEYAAAISIVVFIGVPHIPGELADLPSQRLSVQTSLRPSGWPRRETFFVRFWELPASWALAAAVPGAIITVLFYFDHEISSIICTLGPRYGIRKKGGYAWDVALLGLTTALCGVLGIPPANGLLPQAPLHSESLRYFAEEGEEEDEEGEDGDEERRGEGETETEEGVFELDGDNLAGTDVPAPLSSPGSTTVGKEAETTRRQGPPTPTPTPATPRPRTKHLVPRVHEQRYSNALQSALIIAFISPPFQRLLGLTPTSVLAGLFLFMAYQSLLVNPILPRAAHLLTPPADLPPLPPGVTWRGVHGYTLVQVAATGVVFGLTLTVAAPAFPLVIIMLVPVRLVVMRKIWGRETLMWVDEWACRPGRPEDDEDAVVDEDGHDDGNVGGDGNGGVGGEPDPEKGLAVVVGQRIVGAQVDGEAVVARRKGRAV